MLLSSSVLLLTVSQYEVNTTQVYDVKLQAAIRASMKVLSGLFNDLMRHKVGYLNP